MIEQYESRGDDFVTLTIDRGSGEPLYAQICASLRGQIESGALPPGAALPTEQSLQEIYGVSRSVVRQALDRLAQDGLISREQGRGTRVLPPHHYRRRAGQAGGLKQQIAALGGELSTRVIALDLREPPARESEQLASGPAWRLERVRSVEGEPLIHMVTWIPRALAPSLSVAELDGGSLHEWMRAHGLTPQGGPRQLHAVAASRPTATHLNIPAASPVTLLEGITRDQSGRTIEAFSAWHHPQVVFDLDAEVGQSPLSGSAEELIQELRSLISKS
jgi:GntR family transcriptional regulator